MLPVRFDYMLATSWSAHNVAAVVRLNKYITLTSPLDVAYDFANWTALC